jgi:glycosyltransferase 2 family protein
MKILLKFTVGIALLIILLRFIDWRRSVVILLDTSPLPVLVALFVVSLNMLISTHKWYILLLAQSIVVPWGWLLKCYWIGSFFSNYLPSNIGGDMVRLMMMQHLKNSAQVAASIFLERLTGFVVLLGFSMFTLLMRPQHFMIGNFRSIFLVMLSILFMSIILILLTRTYLSKFFMGFFQGDKSYIGNIGRKFKNLFVSIFYYREKKGEIVLTLILSLPFYCLIILFQYLIFIAIGRKVSLLEVFFIAPLIPLVSLLPVSLNGIGLAEGAFVVFYVQAGVEPEVALAATVLRRALCVVVSLVGGVLWLAYQSKMRGSGGDLVVFVRRLAGIR